MKTILRLVFACSISLFTACTTSSLAPSAPPMAKSSAYGEARTSRVLVKTGSMSIEVNSVKESTAKVRGLVKQKKGYVENITSNDSGSSSASLTVRVPKNSLLTTMDELAALGKVTSRNVEVEDVTDEWIDLQAKVKNLRALRDRLRRLLEKAGNVKDVLAVEKELTRVQSELDSLEGRIKAMQQNVSYSKISIRIHHKSIPGPLGVVSKGTWWGVKKLFVIRD
ncbi:hypothetical protein NT6N_10900 [Oceaniferula spumae]|uniref:DUF4349 domain-containing protein n=1 Tax=Oceaniferula spumae TaxID=2979115 RepID=A0AAT9FJ81_9BACT